MEKAVKKVRVRITKPKFGVPESVVENLKAAELWLHWRKGAEICQDEDEISRDVSDESMQEEDDEDEVVEKFCISGLPSSKSTKEDLDDSSSLWADLKHILLEI